MVLHLDDYPATLELLAAVAGGRHNLSFGELGYEATEHGARVDWTILVTAPLTASERAVVHIAHGCMTLEARNDIDEHLADVVVDVVTRVVSGEQSAASPLANVTGVHDLWWNDLANRLNTCSVQGGDSLRRSEGNAFAAGALLPATGRALPGWERDATLAAIERLVEAGFVVRSVLAPCDLPDGESFTGSPVVGGAELVVDDVVVTVVTYIDDAAEIYTRISGMSWPTELDE